MSEPTIYKVLTVESIPTLISKIKEKIQASEAAAKNYADGKILELPTSASVLAEAQSYTDGKIADLVGGAPEALDTLKELSEALGDDKDFAATITAQVTDAKEAAAAATEAAEEIRTDLEGKADKSTVTALSATVAGKADASDLTALSTTVAGKAEASDLTALSTTVAGLSTTVAGKADSATVTAMQATLNTKADASAVENCLTASNFVEIGALEIDEMIAAAFEAEED